MNTSHTWRPALGFSIYDVRTLSVPRIFCRTARESTYIRRYYTHAMACHTVWIFFPFLDKVHSRYYTSRMICGSYCAWYNPVGNIRVHTDNPYWPVRSIGRKHADEHAWLSLTSHIRVSFAVRLQVWHYCSMSILVFFTLPVVRARASASIQMANIFCRPRNHDCDMAINLVIVIINPYQVNSGWSETCHGVIPCLMS